MNIQAYVYDSATAPGHVETVRERLQQRTAEVDLIDVAAGDSQQQRRKAILTVKNAVRIGSLPEELFDDEGTPDFSAGVLITEAETGRRSMHVGREAVDALEEQ